MAHITKLLNRFTFYFAAAIIIALFALLSKNYSKQFDEIEKGYAQLTHINLDKGISESNLSTILYRNGYVKTKEDAAFISQQIAEKLETQSLTNLYDLNKLAWQVPASQIEGLPDGELKTRYEETRRSLGIAEIKDSEFVCPTDASLTIDKEHKGEITVNVYKEDSTKNSFFDKGKSSFADVIVRLDRHHLDSLNTPITETLAYLKTDNSGKVTFKGLDLDYSYSVLPINEGFEFGSPNGTIGGNLGQCESSGKMEFSFTGREHKVRLLNNITLKQIKEDRTITVRTPKEFRSTLITYLVLFFVGWWILYLSGRKHRSAIRTSIISIMMMLTGVCLLTMFSINDPLTDKMIGKDMAAGIISGIVCIWLLGFVDFVKLYQNQYRIGFDIPLEIFLWFMKPFRQKTSYLTDSMRNSNSSLKKMLSLVLVIICLPLLLLDLLQITRLGNWLSRKAALLPKGIGYLLLALLITILLFTPLGVAIGGMKVNLNIGIVFQPSEIAKYLIIIFMSAFFCLNADKIIRYSEAGNTSLYKSKLKTLLTIIIGLGLLMGIYMFLGDMGPALVLAFTFIILYSIIKSKISLENTNDEEKLKRIFSCDLAMLIYGILTFIGFLFAGYVLDNMGIFCLLWFGVWIAIGVIRKQFFESAFLFNLIIAAFIFGGTILKEIPGLDSVGNRLESRKEMCTNTWGEIGLNGAVPDPGENTQVAEGLWGLATGGIFGQGLGNGDPRQIPAFHTDMVLESIGEQMGFIGLLFIIVLIALLLRKSIIVGYRTTHPFAFYMCLGIAIVTGVQFMIIALGSTGFIPLTGVTVPFFSYGKVSMILNLLAFGIVLSIAKSTETVSDTATSAYKSREKNITKYNYSVALLSIMYSSLALIVMGIFLNYQLFNRDTTLVRPVYVNNANGVPVISYNPRIDLLTKNLHSGNIYDRNGVLLATSDKSMLKKYFPIYNKYGLTPDTTLIQQRYYPFANHMFFMLGDFNTKLFFSYDESNPTGYKAESQHLSMLRGYDNRMKDAEGNPIKVNLVSDQYRVNKYFAADREYRREGIIIRDYSALVPYLKVGHNNIDYDDNKMFLISESIEPKDLHLTVDAQLQTRIQNRLQEYVEQHYPKNNLIRISVVITDAQDGDLLTSANYPLPDQEILSSLPDTYKYYSDYNKPKSWKAYTDLDLGLGFYTQPGSTAKVMSAMAGLSGLKEDVEKCIYNVQPYEVVGLEPIGYVSMRDAIVKSSNCYFIKLINEKNLYDELIPIYKNLGARIENSIPYTLHYMEANDTLNWISVFNKERVGAVETYELLKDKNKTSEEKEKLRKHKAWLWLWGQGGLTATPLVMAKVASTVVNNGNMPTTRYTLDDEIKSVEILGDEVQLLKSYMKAESKEHSKFTMDNIGGKTGTADRAIIQRGVYRIQNDGWYICFIEGANIRSNVDGKSRTNTHPIAIAVRMERIGGQMSGQAVALTKNVIINILKEMGYIN